MDDATYAECTAILVAVAIPRIPDDSAPASGIGQLQVHVLEPPRHLQDLIRRGGQDGNGSDRWLRAQLEVLRPVEPAVAELQFHAFPLEERPPSCGHEGSLHLDGLDMDRDRLPGAYADDLDRAVGGALDRVDDERLPQCDPSTEGRPLLA